MGTWCTRLEQPKCCERGGEGVVEIEGRGARGILNVK